MNQQEAELAIRASSIQKAYCSVINCNEPATHQDPAPFCQKHFDEWELEDAEWAVESAQKHLDKLKEKHKPRKMKIGNDMTEKIRDFREWLKGE